MKRRPRSENRRVLRKLEATTIGSRVFPFRSPPTSMPSVGARRSTRVFVPKASAAKARPSRSSLPQSRSDVDDNDWLPLAWWKPEEGKRRCSGVGVAGWNKSAVMPAEPTPAPAAAAAAAPEPGNPRLVYRRSRKRKLVLKELKRLDRPRSTEINYVYSRKRRRSQMEASSSASASKCNFKGLYYVRRPQKKLKLDSLVEPLAVVVPVESVVKGRELEDPAMQVAITELGMVEVGQREDAAMPLESGRADDREQEDAAPELGMVEDREHEDTTMQPALESGRVEDREHGDVAMQPALMESGRVEVREQEDAAMQLALMESGRVEVREHEVAVMQPALESGRVEDREHEDAAQEDAAMQLALMESGRVEVREQEDAAMQLALMESGKDFGEKVVGISESDICTRPDGLMLAEPSSHGGVECREIVVQYGEHVDAATQIVITEPACVSEGNLSSVPIEPLPHAMLVEPSQNGEMVCKETVGVDRRQEDTATQLVISESACFSEGNLSSVPNEPLPQAMPVELSGHDEMACKETVVDDRGQEDTATQLVISESTCFSEGNLSSVPNEPLPHAMFVEPSGHGELTCKETVADDRGQEDAATRLVIMESASYHGACKETVVDGRGQEDAGTQLVISESTCFSDDNLSNVPNEPLSHTMLVEPSGHEEMTCKDTVMDDRGQEDAATQLVIKESGDDFAEMVVDVSEGDLCTVVDDPFALDMLVKPSGNGGEAACRETLAEDGGHEDAAMQADGPLALDMIVKSSGNDREAACRETVSEDSGREDAAMQTDEPLALDMIVKSSCNGGEAAYRETVAEARRHEDAAMQLVITESVRNFAELVGVSGGDLCTSPDELLSLAVLVEPSCRGGVDRFARILSLVVRWMTRPRAALWSLTMILFSESLVDVFALHGIHFLPLQLSNIDILRRNAVSGFGLCKIYNAKQSVPLVSIDFSTLPLFFKDLHIALALDSFYLSGVLIRYLMDTSWFEEERYAIVPVESRVVTSSFTPIVSNEVTSFSDSVVACNELTSFSDPIVASDELVPFLDPVESSNELVAVADAPELVVQNMAIGHSSNLQKHPKKKRKMRSRANHKVAVSLQASCPSLHNFMEPIRVKPVDAWVGDMAREYDDTTSPCGPLKSRKFEGTREMKSALAEIKQNIDSARCNVNILVTATDRCWRVEGAELMLEFSDSREWCIAVKVQDIIRYLHKPQEWRPCAVNRLNHTYMWGWEDGWKLEFFDKWDWYVFKELHAECRERNALGVPVKIIPVPGVQEVSDYDVLISSSFTRPDMYICTASDEIERAVASEHASYDMDSGDEEWLKQLSEDNSPVHIPADVFEKIIFALETNAYNNPHDIPDKERAVVLCQDLGGRDIVACLYDYWLKKRNKSRSSLVKVFQVPPLTGTQFLQKPHLRKKRSLTRQRSQARRGKPDFYLQAGAEQEARRRVHEAEIAANQATEAAIHQRNRAQVLMENAELAAYKSAMALRIAEAKRVSESSHIASVILD